jgi:tetratricopeptide (TPR) repeat protein/tRNA A-37 threonylcarbamoyl transferase component Bud32
MPTEDTCPAAGSLAAFHRGELPEPGLDRIARHLEVCLACSKMLAQLESEPDPLLDALRLGPGPPVFCRVTEPDATAGPPPSPDVAGYQILGPLGAGGMGVVFKARHIRLGRLVALKRLRTDSLFDLHRFRREAEAAATLQHPNVVQVFEVGEADGQPYLALEYIDGGSLSDFLRDGPQPPGDAAALVETLAWAVEHAHRRGVIHRDLKPANILLQRNGEAHVAGGTARVRSSLAGFTPKVTDFGIAKRIEGSGDGPEDGVTRTGAILGTPAYMAPEQAEGRPVGPAADLYALGVILYEVLVGQPPFQGESSYDILTKVVHADPSPPSRSRPGLPRDLETVCLKCLSKPPAQRYASAAELAADLRRFLDGQPVLARPVRAWEAAWKWARRRPGLAATLVVAQLSLLVLAVGTSWFNGRLREALGSTREAQRRAEANAGLALDAHKQLVGQVQSLLRDAPGTRSLRRELLQTAVAGLQRLTDADASEPRLSRITAHELMGEIQWELGHSAQAIAELESCRRMALELLAREPGLVPARSALANACRRLGSYHLGGDRPGLALQYDREALEVATRWRQAHPGDREALRAELEAYEGLAHAAHWVHDLPACLAALGPLRTRSEAWLAEEPESAKAQQLLGSALELLASIAESEGDLKAALAYQERSLELAVRDERREAARARVSSAGPGAAFRWVIVSLNNLAATHANLGDLPRARSRMDDALARARRWAASDPEDVQRRLDLVDALVSRASIELFDRNYPDAIAPLTECRELLRRLEAEGLLEGRPLYGLERRDFVEREIEVCQRFPAALADDSAIWQAPGHIAHRLTLAKVGHLLASGQPDGAVATATRLLHSSPGSPGEWFDLALTCSQVADAFPLSQPGGPAPEITLLLLDRGLAALARTIALGESPPTAEVLRNDDRFAALRTHPGYPAVFSSAEQAVARDTERAGTTRTP